jgi:hypothetical protein
VENYLRGIKINTDFRQRKIKKAKIKGWQNANKKIKGWHFASLPICCSN